LYLKKIPYVSYKKYVISYFIGTMIFTPYFHFRIQR
jgi:hypothetical protein